MRRIGSECDQDESQTWSEPWRGGECGGLSGRPEGGGGGEEGRRGGREGGREERVGGRREREGGRKAGWEGGREGGEKDEGEGRRRAGEGGRKSRMGGRGGDTITEGAKTASAIQKMLTSMGLGLGGSAINCLNSAMERGESDMKVKRSVRVGEREEEREGSYFRGVFLESEFLYYPPKV